ncbi:MAG: hypothetical protein AB8I08_30645 [Sandaracinaceae bacterium]
MWKRNDRSHGVFIGFALSTLLACGGAADPDAGPPDATVLDARTPGVDGGRPSDASEADDAGVDAGSVPRCATFAARNAGELASTALDELSGLAASRTHDGLLYANNDSGDSPRVFLLSTDGSDLGTISLTGADHRDYEDIAVGSGPGGVHVYVGDIGDNRARTGSGSPRDEIVVYRFPEPSLDLTTAPLALEVTPEAFTFTYPGAPQDCESLAVADNGDLYFLSKVDSGASTLYVARAPLVSGELTRLVDVTFPSGSELATAMDIAPGNGALLVRTYDRLHLYPRLGAQSFADALLGVPIAVSGRPEIQGESVGWRPDGRGYFTASEGDQPPLFAFEAETPCRGW